MVPRAELPQAAILLYRCRLPSQADETHLQAGLQHLPAALRADILRFRQLRDRLQRLTARRLLSAALRDSGRQRLSGLEGWRADRHGRPYLEKGGIDFSLSHSGPWVVCALVGGARVGVDIEAWRPLAMEEMRPYLTGAEKERIGRSPEPSRELLRCWTLREAVLKADGRGLLASEAEIRDIHRLITPRGNRWRVEQVPAAEACLTLATSHATAPLQLAERDFYALL